MSDEGATHSDELALFVMRAFADAAALLAEAGVSRDALAGGMLAAAMNEWGNLHGFDKVADWVAEAHRSALAYVPPPCSGRH